MIGNLMDCIENGRAVVRVAGIQLLQAYVHPCDDLVISVLRGLAVEDEDEAVGMAATDALLVLDP